MQAGLYLLPFFDLTGGSDTKLFKFTCLYQHTAFQTSDRAVISIGGVCQSSMQFFKMLRQHGNPFVEFIAQIADLFCVGGEIFLAPAVGNRLQQCNEGSGRCDDNLLAEAVVQQLRIMFQCRTEKRLGRQEENDKFRRGLKLFPVFLGAELVDMVAYLPGMGF